MGPVIFSKPPSYFITGQSVPLVMDLLWVAMTTVVPVLLSSSKRCMILAAIWSSTFPVGSSANRSFGRAITALAMATRCC